MLRGDRLPVTQVSPRRLVWWGSDATLFLADDGVWLTRLENPKTSDRAAARLPLRGSPDAGATAATATMRQGVNLKLSFPGSNPHPQIVGFDLLPTKVAYFVGTDSTTQNAFVTLLHPGGHGLNDVVASTYIGGTGQNGETPIGIQVDATGNVYIAGYTDSTDFPTNGTKSNPYQKTSPACPGSLTGFVAELNSTLSTLVYGTYYGGTNTVFTSCSANTHLNALTLDSVGNVLIAGETTAPDLPTTPGGYQRTCGRAALPPLKGSYLVGSRANGIVLDGSGNAYLSGETTALDFPTTAGTFQTGCTGSLQGNGCDSAYLVKLDSSLKTLLYSVFIGGTGYTNAGGCSYFSFANYGNPLGIDTSNDTWVVGQTTAPDLPVTLHSFQSQPIPGNLFSGGNEGFGLRLNTRASIATPPR